jgi:Domain of unknown function (DUF1330)
MAAYLIVEHIITDAAKFEEYRTNVGPMIAKHGGRYLTEGGSQCVQDILDFVAEQLEAAIPIRPERFRNIEGVRPIPLA